MPHSRYLKTLLLATVAAVATVLAFTVVVDPYRLYRLVRVPGFNQVKPQPGQYLQEIKTELARASGADIIFIGNSRTEIGFDAANALLNEGGHRAYNLGLAARVTADARSAYEQLRAVGQPRSRLIVGLEFLDFLRPAHYKAPAPVARMRAPGALQWRADTLFSMTSVLDAVKTLRIQGKGEAETISDSGFNPLLQYQQMARDGGYRALFQQRANDYAARFLRSPHQLLAEGSDSSDVFDHLDAIVQQAASDGTAVDLVIYPYHAQIMALFDATGLQPVFGQWKQLLVQRMALWRAVHPQLRIRLFDFSGFGGQRCETIPAAGDKTSRTRWYWEAGHFKAALGDLMIERMAAAQDAPDGPGDAFGVQLSSANVAGQGARIARERAACMAQYPALFEETDALVRSLGGAQPGPDKG